ncbi:STM3941 family protein [Pseudomonas sp. zbq_18]|uniref:STM3941 family protein n=1 Tax=Pseudomonas sp. zbq_18 TaxID=3367251 RepID=UPI00370C14B5
MSRTLRPRPWKWLGILLLCLGLCVIAVLMLRDGRAMGWFCLAVFGLGSLIAALALLPGANYLRLENEGFTFSSLFRAHFVRWDEVDGFGLVRVASNDMVGWRYREGRQPPGRGVRLSQALAGCHAALPENYGLSAEELARCMERLRLAHAAGDGAAALELLQSQGERA